jgi:hypothetical protein
VPPPGGAEDAAMSGDPTGVPPDPSPADPAAGGAGDDRRAAAGSRPGAPDAGPPAWDPLSGWDEEPGGAWDGWPPGGDAGPWGAVQPRKGSPRSGGPGEDGWRGRPAARLGLVGLAVAVLALLAGALLRPGVPAQGDAGRPGPARPGPAGQGYAFAPPQGWRDATAVLAPRFSGPRPEVVLVGPSSAGFGANLSVVRTGAGPSPPPLAALPAAALRQLGGAGARLVGPARRRTLGGEPAVAADYALPRGGGRLRARQIACYHRGDLYLVTLTAEAGAFGSQARAQDRLVGSWRWT